MTDYTGVKGYDFHALAAARGLTYDNGNYKGQKVKSDVGVPKSTFIRFATGEINPVGGKTFNMFSQFFNIPKTHLRAFIKWRKKVLTIDPNADMVNDWKGEYLAEELEHPAPSDATIDKFYEDKKGEKVSANENESKKGFTL